MTTEYLVPAEREAAAVEAVKRMIQTALKGVDPTKLEAGVATGADHPLVVDDYVRYMPLLTVEDSGFPTGDGFIAQDLSESGNAYTDGCFLLTSTLYQALKYHGIEMEIRLNKRHNHLYGVITYDGVEVIIDPSIGQIVRGHARMFIGTRSQLKQLTEHAHATNSLVNLRYFRKELEMFESDNPTSADILWAFWNIE